MAAETPFERLSISVVVMVYNEAETLREAVSEVLAATRPLGRPLELLIIDNCSTDGSAEVADALSTEEAEVRVVRHEENAGLGGVYRTAFSAVKNDLVYFMAADLQPIPAEYFRDMFPCFSEADVVVGLDRRRKAPLLHRAFSQIERILFAIVFPGTPKIGGPLMIRREWLQPERLHFVEHPDRSWIVLWEMIIRAVRDDARVKVVPIDRRARVQGKSRGSTWGNALRMLGRLLTLRRIL